MGQSVSFVPSSVQTVKYLTLNGKTYTAIVYGGEYFGGGLTNGLVIDTKSVSGVNGAINDIVNFYRGKPNASANITNAFNSIVSAFGPPPNCSLTFNPFPVNCATVIIDPSGRQIDLQMSLIAIQVIGNPIGQNVEPGFPFINNTYLLSSNQASNAFNFFVPDYFVKAQNSNKLNTTTNWSYVPDFDLAIHKVEGKKCKERKECCNCKRCRSKREQNRPFTTMADLHSMLSQIYNIAHLVEEDQLPPADGEAQVMAIWDSFKKYEVSSPETFKSVNISGDIGSIGMFVRYRLSDSEVIVAMSITGTYLGGVYFNVSTIPIGGDNTPDAKHVYNKAIGQFVQP